MKFDLVEIRSQLNPDWSPVNIAIMLVMFWVFWPFGVAVVAYVIWGDRVGLDFSQSGSFQRFGRQLMRGLRSFVDGFSGNERESFEKWRDDETAKLQQERAALEKEKQALHDKQKA